MKKLIEQDIIEPSQSPFRSPMLLVKKSDGSFRPVIDFRFVNKLTKFDAEPMPNQETIYAKLASAKYLTKIDFTKGYWQVPMKESDKEKTAFSTPLGHMQFKGNRNNKTFLQRLRCILWVITLHSTISYYKMRFYTRKTELEASTCQFPQKL